MKLPKLSKPQSDLFNLLRSGEWTLGVDNTMNGGAYVQEGELGHGGKTKTVHVATVFKLSSLGLIRSGPYGFPIKAYEITSYGKEVSKAMAIEEAKAGKEVA